MSNHDPSNSIQTRSGSRYTRSDYTTETTENLGNSSFVELHNSSGIVVADEDFEKTVLIPSNSDPPAGELQTPFKSASDKFIEEARLQSANPYHVKDVCPICTSPVTEDQHGLECESCFIWHHCACQNIADDEYIRMQNNHDDRWICHQCQEKEPGYHTGGGANPKHAGICHLGMGKNGEKWGKMGQIKNFEIHV